MLDEMPQVLSPSVETIVGCKSYPFVMLSRNLLVQTCSVPLIY